MKICTLFLVIFFSLAGLISCREESEVGSKDKPFSMYFVPSDETQKIEQIAGKISAHVAKRVSQALYGKDEGFFVKTAVPMSYVAVIEAFGTERADFAAINTFGYILLKDKKNYPAEAIVNLVREGQTSYKAQIITRIDSGINKLEDLNGKRFAYVDSTSTSGYILPSLLLQERGIKPASTVFASRHDNVVTMIYQGQVDAGATYHSPPHNGEPRDARQRVKTQFPDVFQKIKIVEFTKEIPNAPFIMRTNVFKDQEKYKKVKETIQNALIEYIQTPEGAEAFMQLYSISGLVKAKDSDFDEMRAMFKKLDMDLEKML